MYLGGSVRLWLARSVILCLSSSCDDGGLASSVSENGSAGKWLRSSSSTSCSRRYVGVLGGDTIVVSSRRAFSSLGERYFSFRGLSDMVFRINLKMYGLSRLPRGITQENDSYTARMLFQIYQIVHKLLKSTVVYLAD